jgi:uncharacterized protein YhaN
VDADTKKILEESRDGLHEAVLTCRESRRLLEDIAELEDETADIAYLRKDNVELQQELATCRQELAAVREMAEDYDGQRRELAERLAAAEARERELRQEWYDVVEMLRNGAWKSDFKRTIKAIDRLLESKPDHEALDAALERAYENGLVRGREEGRNQALDEMRA